MKKAPDENLGLAQPSKNWAIKNLSLIEKTVIARGMI